VFENPHGPNEYDMYGLEASYSAGYFSTERIDDGVTYKFRLCEKCLENLFDSFKLPVNISYYMPYSDDLEAPRWKKKEDKS
jgi:hypothetical protein